VVSWVVDIPPLLRWGLAWESWIAIRGVVGVGLIAVGLFMVKGVVGVLLGLVGAVLIFSGTVGFCHVYKVLHIRTSKKA
jgi:Protein of unknown function (DUF2892)